MAALSSFPRVVILSAKKVENSSAEIESLGISFVDLASLLDWCLTSSKSLLGLFLAFSSSDLKNSFLTCECSCCRHFWPGGEVLGERL